MTTTIGARYDALVPTGANPFVQCLDFRLLQIRGYTANRNIAQTIANELTTVDKAIVNASYGFPDECGAQTCAAACTPAMLNTVRAADRAFAAADYRQLLGQQLNDVLVTAAAGNEACQTILANLSGRRDGGDDVAFRADGRKRFGPRLRCGFQLVGAARGVRSRRRLFDSLTATVAERANLESYLAALEQTSVTANPNVMIVGSSDGTLAEIELLGRGRSRARGRRERALPGSSTS